MYLEPENNMKKKTTEEKTRKGKIKKNHDGPNSVNEFPCSAISWREKHLSMCLF